MIIVSIPWDTPKIKCWNWKNQQPKFKKFQNAQLNAGLIKPKLNFIHAVATQEDTRDIWAQNKFKVSDLLAEKKMDLRTEKTTGQNQWGIDQS